MPTQALTVQRFNRRLMLGLSPSLQTILRPESQDRFNDVLRETASLRPPRCCMVGSVTCSREALDVDHIHVLNSHTEKCTAKRKAHEKQKSMEEGDVFLGW